MADDSSLYGDHGKSASPTTSRCSSRQALVAPNNDSDTVVLEGGLSIAKAGIFAIAQMAGTGMLALPSAFMKTGWGGTVILTVVFLIALYCGIMLGKCWEIVRRENAIEGHVRDPYPLIGEYAMGKFGKYLVSVCVVLTLFGAVIVYLIIASRLTENLFSELPSIDKDFNQEKVWVLIFGGVLVPLTWFASPKDMSFVGYIAGGSSVLACILIIMRLLLKYITDGHAKSCTEIPMAYNTFIQPFGSIAFAYGGAMIFPTLQSDMRQPGKFTYSAIIGFVGISILYFPMFVLPYIVLGGVDNENILLQLVKLNGLEGKILVQIAEGLMVFHLLFVTLVSINPVSQQFEEIFKSPQRFGWKRVAIRTSIMLATMVIAIAYSNFGPILNLIGASTITITCFILPVVFYMQIQQPELIPLRQTVLHAAIVLVSFALGAISTYLDVKYFITK